MITNKPCSVETCNRTVEVNGYCKPHAHRVRMHGDPLAHVPIRNKAGQFGCSVEGCEGSHYSKGLCKGHKKTADYLQVRIDERIAFLEEHGYSVTKLD